MGEEDQKFAERSFRAECLRLALDTLRPPFTPDGDDVLAVAKKYAEWVLEG